MSHRGYASRLAAALAATGIIFLAVAQDAALFGVNCSFQTDPVEFLQRESRSRSDLFERTRKFSGLRSAAQARTVAPSSLPRASFIDTHIFDRLQQAGVESAPLASDSEFLRRIYLDLTGRIPPAAEARAFLEDSSTEKRRALIDRLLYSAEFSDRWTMWLGDLLGNTQQAANFNRQFQGRNSMHQWMRTVIAQNKPLRDIAYEAVVARGNNYDDEAGPANFLLGGVSNGPIQDTYDLMMVKTVGTFLGMGQYDCIVCHDGRRHLDQLSLWGKTALRIDAYRMSAFFSRLRRIGNNDPQSPYLNSNHVYDLTTGAYDLNTNFGNRPNRTAIGTLRSLTPEYHFSKNVPANNDWRGQFGDFLAADPMLARNFANRIWKEMFNLALIEPVDGLDPARLDPKNPPPAPWTLQATHPELFEELAQALHNSNYNLREFLRLIAESTAYQLSSRYDGPWDVNHVPLFARHYPRRLMGEEIHDAIQTATGVKGRYTVQGWVDSVEWAMQLPEPVEPRSNGAVATFMNTFLRGNRDTQVRRQSGSIQQQLALMNDAFLYNRARVATSPVLLAVSRVTDNNAAVDELFLTHLTRLPSEYERAKAVEHLKKAANAAARNTAIEDLSWALMNKVEFIFSY